MMMKYAYNTFNIVLNYFKRNLDSGLDKIIATEMLLLLKPHKN